MLTGNAIVLSGGGSRGAYEAGVLRYVFEALPKRLGHPVPIDVLTGTSVGAINAYFMGAAIDDPAEAARRLCANWRSLEIEQLLGFRARDMVRATRLLLGATPPAPRPGTFRYGGLLNTAGMERFVLSSIDWRGLRRNLRSGRLRGLALSATHVGTGHTTVFIDNAGVVPTEWSRDPFVRHVGAPLGPRHVLASAAIPMLFPSVKIGQSFYVDGGLRQNTPMSPAIRMGADRVLVVSLRYVGSQSRQIEEEREEAYPKPLFLAGKALNALMLDHTDYDLDRMRRFNLILEAGRRAFGEDFERVIGDELIKIRGAPMRPIQAVHIRPSEDIGILASQLLRSGRIKLRGRVARRLFANLSRGEGRSEGDLLSYLLFDGTYGAALVDLGYRDAAAHEQELCELFARRD